jgi:hypothetical protein
MQLPFEESAAHPLISFLALAFLLAATCLTRRLRWAITGAGVGPKNHLCILDGSLRERKRVLSTVEVG